MRNPTSALEPLNAHADFVWWDRLHPEHQDFNPCLLVQPDGTTLALFRRVPRNPSDDPIGSIWCVALDDRLVPQGEPELVIARGEDPRAVRIGETTYVFYTSPVTGEDGRILTTCMALRVGRFIGTRWEPRGDYALPMNPLNAPGPVQPEKNWVPMADGDQHIALIYKHKPWTVIRLNVGAEKAPHFDNVALHPGLGWRYGEIRGGTVPMPWKNGELITFFHSSMVMGGRNLYFVGAATFKGSAPYTPMTITAEPLLAAPFAHSTAQGGWTSNFSVVFPLGCTRDSQGDYVLSCGVQDCRIGLFTVKSADLLCRLEPVGSREEVKMFNLDTGQHLETSDRPLLHVPSAVGGVAEWSIIRFVEFFLGAGGRTFIDIGAHIGFYTVALARQFDRILAFEPSRFQLQWLKRNVELNRLDHVEVRAEGVGDETTVKNIYVATRDGGYNTFDDEVSRKFDLLDQYQVPLVALDSLDLHDVDFIKIDVEGYEAKVIAGARQTLQRCRPLILLEVWADPVRRQDIQRMLEPLGYTMEFVFPSSAELALCIPLEKRERYAWFV